MKPAKRKPASQPPFNLCNMAAAGWLIMALSLCGSAAFAAGQTGAEENGGEEIGFTAGGYVKSFFTVLQPAAFQGLTPLSGDNPAEGTAADNIRIKLTWKPDESFSLAAAYELTPQIQLADPAVIYPLPQINTFFYRAYDLDQNLYPQPGKPSAGFQLVQNLDRFFMTYSRSFGDILIGRQPVALGTAHVINPTDVLAPFTFQTLDTEERIGVDAVRLKIPVGLLGELDTGCVFGKAGFWEQNAVFIRQKLNVCDTDFTGLVMDFRENLLLGLDFNRSVGGGPASGWKPRMSWRALSEGAMRPRIICGCPPARIIT